MVTESLYTYYMHGIDEREADTLRQPQPSGDSEDSEIQKKIVNYDNVPGVEDLESPLERQTRISITIRHVPNTKHVDIARLLKRTLYKP